jgi:outer membrane protein OmpA-like peptidoglycan-associated protein
MCNAPNKLLYITQMKKLYIFSCLCFLLAGTVIGQEKATVYFETNSSTLTSTITSSLDAIIAQKSSISSEKGITIAGHCDILGDNNFNDILSRWRVKAVRDYLTIRGIDPTLIKSTIGYGKRKPLNNNKTEEQKALNRRVEISYSTT